MIFQQIPTLVPSSQQQQQQQVNDELPSASTYYLFDQSTPAQSPLPQDVAYEMEVVDELVRSRSEDLPDWDDDNSSESAESSASSITSSPRSDSSYGCNGSSCSNDDDWSPKRATVAGSAAAGTNKPRRNKPYARSTEDKKFRKKEQNKNAATRYRQKKKAEIEIVLEEERELQDENDKLKTSFADVRREIKYMKSLMRDLYRAKGIL